MFPLERQKWESCQLFYLKKLDIGMLKNLKHQCISPNSMSYERKIDINVSLGKQPQEKYRFFIL
jgi:hypothetical protein